MVQLARAKQRHSWGLLGTSLVVAALIVLVAASLHVDGLPSKPFRCDTFQCKDPIYDLRTPYAFLAIGAVLVGILGAFLLILSRPIRNSRYAGPPRSWSRVLTILLLLIGIAAGVLLPWLVLLNGWLPWSVATVSLTILLSSGIVHGVLWWWLRRQHGMDRHAWNAALTVQAFVTILTAAIALPLFIFAFLIAPALQFILLLIGAKLAASNPAEDAWDEAVEPDKAASTTQLAVTAVVVLGIALGTVWAAWPRAVPEQLQARIEAGDWPVEKQSAPPEEPPQTSSPAPSRTPASNPTEAAPECSGTAVEVTIDGWDAATGARTAALVVTNEHSSQACRLEGLPEFRIIQAEDDLDVVTSEYGPSSETDEQYPNITVGPSESAQAILHWRGERSAYHDASAQQAEVRIGGEWVEAEFEFQQDNIPSDSPFDLIERSELRISEWAPSE